MTKDKGGRPTVMTRDVIGKLEYAFRLGCTDLEACLCADINPSSLYDYQNKNPDFTKRKEALKETPVFKARESVVNDLETNPTLAFNYLKAKRSDEFAEKRKQELSGNLSINEALAQIDAPTEDETEGFKE